MTKKTTTKQEEKTGMIFSFYSYKGGVGRSQLCANVAAYLCHKKNKRVLLLDWDFEAPGLHYYFGKKDQDLQVKGSLELLENYTAMMLTQEQVSQEDYQGFELENIINVLTAKGWKEETKGCVDLIPAGQYDQDYSSRINNFNWFQFYNRLDGKVYIEWLKQQLKALKKDPNQENSTYDYILIDSRTGINDYSGICNLHLPDANIVIMAANSQNMQGCKNLIDQIIHHPYTQHENQYRTKYILPVLSRINVNNPNFDHWANEFVQHFQPLMEHWETALPDAFKADIFRDFYLEKTLLEDMPQYSAGENVLFQERVQRIHRSSFAAKFANLAQYLEDLKEKGKIQLEEQVDRDAWEYYAQEAELLYKEGKEEIAMKDVAFAYEQAGDKVNADRFGGTLQLYLEEYKNYYTREEYDRAKQVLLKGKETDPSNAVYYNIELARVYQRLKEWQNALHVLEYAFQVDDKNIHVLVELGKVYQQRGNWKLAKGILEQAIALDRKNSYALVQLGKVHQQLGAWKKAEDILLEAVQINPNDTYAFVQLSNVYSELEQWDKAEKALLKILELRPYSTANRLRLLRIYKKNNQPQKAKKILQELQSLDPNNPNWPIQLTRLHRQQKQWQAAKTTLNQALQNNPKAILEALKKNSKEDPKNPEVHIELGRAYHQLKRWGKALNNYEKALQLDPEHAVASTLIGNVYVSKGSLHIAIEYYQKSLSIDPSSDYVHYRLGNAYRDIGNYTAAIHHFQKSLEINPNNKSSRNNLGVVYHKNGQNQLAVEIYLQSLTMDEDHEVYNNNIGYLYLMTGALEQAHHYLKHSLELGLEDFANRNLGHYHLVKGEKEQALDYYKASWQAFTSKAEFWSGMENDFQYLKQYGLTLETYEVLKTALLDWIQ